MLCVSMWGWVSRHLISCLGGGLGSPFSCGVAKGKREVFVLLKNAGNIPIPVELDHCPILIFDGYLKLPLKERTITILIEVKKKMVGSRAVAGREAGLFKRTVFVFLRICGSVLDLRVHSARVIVMLLLLQLSWWWRGWNCTHATEWSGIVFSV